MQSFSRHARVAVVTTCLVYAKVCLFPGILLWKMRPRNTRGVFSVRVEWWRPCSVSSRVHVRFALTFSEAGLAQRSIYMFGSSISYVTHMDRSGSLLCAETADFATSVSCTGFPHVPKSRENENESLRS